MAWGPEDAATSVETKEFLFVRMVERFLFLHIFKIKKKVIIREVIITDTISTAFLSS
jgi:hypothetical protein